MCERGEADAPEGMELILPDEGMCIKTKQTNTTLGTNAGTKVFVNITHSDKLQEGAPPRRH